MHRVMIAAAFFVGLSAGQASAIVVLPTVTIDETVGGGVGEYTVTIDSAPGADFFIQWFAVGAVESLAVNVTNGIGAWEARRLAPNQWNLGYGFDFTTPGGPEELINTGDLPDFDTAFGDDANFANVYWAGSYQDFQSDFDDLFSLIGPDETRDGFVFNTSIVASSFIASVTDPFGSEFTISGEVTPPAPIPLPATAPALLAAFAALAALSAARKGRNRA